MYANQLSLSIFGHVCLTFYWHIFSRGRWEFSSTALGIEHLLFPIAIGMINCLFTTFSKVIDVFGWHKKNLVNNNCKVLLNPVYFGNYFFLRILLDGNGSWFWYTKKNHATSCIAVWPVLQFLSIVAHFPNNQKRLFSTKLLIWNITYIWKGITIKSIYIYIYIFNRHSTQCQTCNLFKKLPLNTHNH